VALFDEWTGGSSGVSTSSDLDEIDKAWLVDLPGANTPPMVEFFDVQDVHLFSVTIPRKSNKNANAEGWQHIVEVLLAQDG
jgi:hypothetical protein